MRIDHQVNTSTSVSTKTLADDYPWKFDVTNDNSVIIRVRGGKWGDIDYTVTLTEHDLNKIKLVQSMKTI